MIFSAKICFYSSLKTDCLFLSAKTCLICVICVLYVFFSTLITLIDYDFFSEKLIAFFHQRHIRLICVICVICVLQCFFRTLITLIDCFFYQRNICLICVVCVLFFQRKRAFTPL